MTDIILGFGLAIILIVIAYILVSAWSERRKSRDFYLDTIIAYKVGLIVQKAEENKIEMIYPDQKDEFIDSIEKRVESDLNSVD